METLGVQGIPASGIDVFGDRRDESVMNPDLGDLAGLVDAHFTAAKAGKLTKETELIEDLRAWKGEYDPAILSRIAENQSKIFVKLTRSWCGAARSLILNIMGMEGGYPWTIDPTPLPDMENLDLNVLQEAVQEAASMLPPEEAEAFVKEHDFETMLKAEKKQAGIACGQMQKEIEDQLAEQSWESNFTRTLLPYIIYGTQVIQGPMSVPKRPKRWAKDAEGKWRLALKRWDEKQESFDLRPEFKALDIFSVYPDPVASKPEELEYVIVRHVMNRHEMRELTKRPGFDADAVEDILLSHVETGDWVAENWETPVEATTDHTPTPKKHDRFVVKEWWGYLSGQMLRKYNVVVPDSALTSECMANIWVCCGEVLKVSVSNMEPPRLPFFFVPYEDVPGSIWGQGVPRQMDDSQALYNACERAKVNSMGISSGPQVVVDKSRLADNVNATTITPWKVWFVSDMDGLTRDPIQFFQPASNIPHMQAMQQDVRQHLQKETSLPDFVASGVPGNLAHNRTAEGLSMSQNAALAFIRTVIGNIDTYLTQPMIESLYHWNMVFNPKKEIKGDYEVVAKGVSGAMTREIASQRLNQLLIAAGNPEIRPWVKVDNAVQLWAKVMGYEGMDLTYTEKEVMAHKQQELSMQAEADSAPKRVQPVMPRENAVMQLLMHTPETSPMYGPVYEEAAKTWGLLSSRMAASLNAWNQANAGQIAPLVNPKDAAQIAADLTPEEANASPTPAGGPNFPQDAGPGFAPALGEDGGVGTPGELPFSMS